MQTKMKLSKNGCFPVLIRHKKADRMIKKKLADVPQANTDPDKPPSVYFSDFNDRSLNIDNELLGQASGRPPLPGSDRESQHGDYEAVRGRKNRVCVLQPDALREEGLIHHPGPCARESSNTSRAANQVWRRLFPGLLCFGG